MHRFFHWDIGEIIVRSTLSFFVILLIARLLGNKQLSHLTFFNYVTGITIGSIAAEVAVNTEIPLLNGLTSLVWWSFLTAIIGYVSLKSTRARVLFDGQPTILIKHGVIMKESLTTSRLNIDDLSMLLRQKDVFSIKDVDYAILEPTGAISILKKEELSHVIRKDLNLATETPKYLPSEIISDGSIVFRNLKELNIEESWIKEQLSKRGITAVEEVFYAEIQKDGSLYIQKQ